MRCTTAGRTCGGYEEQAGRVFRQYDRLEADNMPPRSAARKCSLPVRVADPETNALPQDIRPQEVSDEKIEEFALRAFYHDYCITSSNPSLSRGYLGGLEPMLRNLGWQSNLAKACKVVAFANHGIRLRRPGLMQKAELLYNNVLVYLVNAIKDPALASTDDSVMIAMLLGLYEVNLTPKPAQHTCM